MPITASQHKTSEPPKKSNAPVNKPSGALQHTVAAPPNAAKNKRIDHVEPVCWTSYLMWAEIAVKKVKQAIPYGAANVESDGWRKDPPAALNRVQRLNQLRDQVKTHVTAATDPIESLWKRAQFAAHVGVGNCHEQAAIAFSYLHQTGREQKLACVAYRSNVPDNQHVFVVLGLDQRPDRLSFKFGQVPDWGFDAVVCDPWAHEWFRVTHDWKRKGQKILQGLNLESNWQQGDHVDVQCLAFIPKED